MKLSYRPEIDGLRAIAVLSVVLYHAKFSFMGENLFTGGFLGVDIFFVISGYLITKLIFLELKSTNKFSFSKFYQRRIRRILPALFFITIITAILGYILLLPYSFKELSQSIIYQLGFISNFYFWSYYHFGYMSENALLLPFLHTWSLSVEEQFYLIVPIILFLIYRFLKKYLNILIITGLVLSLILANYFSPIYKSLTFYMLPFRGWELLAGSLIAYHEVFNIKKNLNFINSSIRNFLSFVSLLTITVYIFLFDSNLSHPSLYSLLLILSVCIIILFSDKRSYVTKILSSKILIGIGLISYSLYLWHYPLFSFARHIYGSSFEKMIIFKMLIIFTSILLSIFTFYFIEKRFRSPNLKFPKAKSILLCVIILILVSNWLIIKNDGYGNRLNLSEFQKEIMNIEAYSLSNFEQNKNFIKNNKNKNVLIVGNSHGYDFYKSLTSNEKLKENFNIKFFFAQTHCLEDIIIKDNDLCERTFNRDKKKMRTGIKNLLDSDIIILKTRWYPKSLANIEDTINFLKEYNKKIVIVSDFSVFRLPEEKIAPLKFNKNIPQKIFFRESFPLERFILEYDRFPNKEELKEIEKKYFLLLKKDILENNEFLENIAKKLNVHFLNHLDLICDTKRKTCTASTSNKNILHSDNAGHVTVKGAKFMGQKILQSNWLNID